MEPSDADIAQFLAGAQDPEAIEAAQKLAPVFRELCKEFDRGEAFDLVKDYWLWLLDGLDVIPVVDDDSDD